MYRPRRHRRDRLVQGEVDDLPGALGCDSARARPSTRGHALGPAVRGVQGQRRGGQRRRPDPAGRRALAGAQADFHEPIELLFIDGAHEYDLVKEDFEKWVPKVVEGGVVAIRAHVDGRPKRVAEELVYRSRAFKDARRIGSLTIGRKVARNRGRDLVRARFQLLVKRLFGVASTVFKTRRHCCRDPSKRRHALLRLMR